MNPAIVPGFPFLEGKMSASNQFNIGKDVTLDIVGQNGPLRFPILTGFEAKPSYKSVDSKALDGVDRYDDFPAGWTGSLSMDRADSSIDDYFAQKEASFYSGIPSSSVTITETIQEIGGNITQYRYTGVALTLQEAGSKSAEAKVAMKIGFRASRRIKVA